jgi:S-adenosylmethionine hydrolase
MKNSFITLLTDFGTKDHYVASMKGTILSINPKCTLIDITHHVSPHDINEGAFILANAYSFFPKGTIHLSVVDPGVGSPRRPILIVTLNYLFVGPDNGLFRIRRGKLIGEILYIDAFGNLISNINEEELFHFVKDHPFVNRIRGRAIQGLKKGYWEGKRNEPIALIGSGGFLEISVREGNAEKMLKVKKGDPIWISTKFPACRQAGKHQIPNKL